MSLRKAFSLVVLLGFVISEIALANEELLKAPPRTIDDVLKVLDRKSSEADPLADVRALISKTVADSASNDEKNLFYRTRAEAYARVGQLDKAILDLQRAVNEYPGRSNTFKISDIHTLSSYEANIGNLNKAIALDLEARSLIRNGQWGMFLQNDQALLSYYSELGDFSAAETYLIDANATLVSLRRSPLFSRFGDWWTASTMLNNATYLSYQGRWLEAEIQLRKALQMSKAWMESIRNHPYNTEGVDPSGDPQGTAFVMRNVISRVLTIQNLLARSLSMQGKVVEAEVIVRDSLDLTLGYYGKNTIQAAAGLHELSNVLAQQNRLIEAGILASKAIQIYKAVGADEGALSVLKVKRSLAKYLVAQGHYAEADKIFTEMDEQIKRSSDTGRKMSSFDADWAVSKVQLGQASVSHQMMEQVISSLRKQSNPSEKLMASMETIDALALHAMGSSDQAYLIYSKYIPVLLNQMEIDEENQTLGGREHDRLNLVLDGYISTLSALADGSKNGNALTAEAFKLADIARGSGVQKALTASAARANIKDVKLAELARKEQDTQRRISSLERILSELISAPPDQQLPAIQKKMKADIAQFKVDREQIRKEIETKFPDYAELVSPKPATIDKVRKQLKSDEVLVSWYFGDKEGFVWAITAEGAPQFKRLSIGRVEMAQSVFKLRKALDPGVATIDDIPQFDVVLANKLYQSLLAPVQSSLQGKKVMLAVPHAELGQLPLSLLVTQSPSVTLKAKGSDFSEYRQIPWLAKDIAVAQLPSVTALNSLRNLPPANANRRQFIGFGDPYFSVIQAKQAANQQARASSKTVAMRSVPLNLRSAPKTTGVSSAELALLPRLPDTKEEIEQIGKALAADPEKDIFLEKFASVTNVLETDLSNRKVVMFATHGLVPGELDGLTQPALALSAPDVTGEAQGDGLLTMEKILTLKLDADWVVLSACNTASGEGAGSEAVSGLGRAFFYAGARALLVSNWPVDSEASRMLMTDLFRRQQMMQGQHKAVYLREAMLDMIRESGSKDPSGKLKYTYAHPLFWAPFVVVGD